MDQRVTDIAAEPKPSTGKALISLLYAARALRGFGDGFAILILPAYMTALGFDVTGIYPVRRDELFRIVNFDCVMINSRHPVVAALADKLVTGRVPSVA